MEIGRFISIVLIFKNGGKVGFGVIKLFSLVWSFDKIFKRIIKLLVVGKFLNEVRRWGNSVL